MFWPRPVIWPPPVISRATNWLAGHRQWSATVSGRAPPVVGHRQWSAASRGLATTSGSLTSVWVDRAGTWWNRAFYTMIVHIISYVSLCCGAHCLWNHGQCDGNAINAIYIMFLRVISCVSLCCGAYCLWNHGQCGGKTRPDLSKCRFCGGGRGASYIG